MYCTLKFTVKIVVFMRDYLRFSSKENFLAATGNVLYSYGVLETELSEGCTKHFTKRKSSAETQQ